MPFHYSIQPEKEIVLVVAEGTIDGKSSVQAILEVVSDPNYVTTDRIIVDLRKIEYQPETQDIFIISDRLASLKSKMEGEITLVVPSPHLYLAHLACVIARAAGIKMDAVTEYEAENQP